MTHALIPVPTPLNATTSGQPARLQPKASSFAATLPLVALGLCLTFGAAGCKSAPPADDASLSAALKTRIAADSAIAAEPIQTSVQGGIATLNGTVSSDAARALAANDAAQVPGIRTVVNNLTIQQAQLAPPPAAAVEPVAPPAPVKSELVRDTEKERRDKERDKQREKNDKKKLAAQSASRNNQPQVSQYGPPPAPIERPAPAPVAVAPPPPPPPAFRTVTLASGSTLPIRITQTLDSATTQQGDSFSGVVATDVIVDGLVAIPQGTPVTGRVTEVHEAAHFKGSSLLTVELTSINRKGEKIPVTTEAFSKEGTGRGKNTAEKIGGGAAVGAILGGIFGGGKGAAIGAASGGALGAGANTITKGQQVQIPSETLVRFRLSNSLALRASTRDASNPNADGGSQRRPLDPNLQ